jgi:hypothetical protein
MGKIAVRIANCRFARVKNCLPVSVVVEYAKPLIDNQGNTIQNS